MLEVMNPMDLKESINKRMSNPSEFMGGVVRSASVMTDTMKHPYTNKETHEFNLGRAMELRCLHQSKRTVCGACESCLLINKVNEARQWFIRFGDHSKKRFMLGLLRRIRSVDLLNNLVSLLQPTLTKDYTYARARTNPSLDTDVATVSSDRAVSPSRVEQETIKMWEWFSHCTYWTKANFLLSLLQHCEVHLLHVLYTQARTLLASEQKVAEVCTEPDIYEASSVMSTKHSHHSENHPELELLSVTRSEYSRLIENPFTGETLPEDDEKDGHNAYFDSDSLTESSSTMDPMLLIMPNSAKAYAGVSRHKDFIRCLPVHLAKRILSMLDMPSLYNGLCVSPNWRALVEEVRHEFGVNQQLKEEVMLMQGAAAQGANPIYANDIDVLVPNLELGTHEVIYTQDDVIKTTFKSEINFDTAFSGVSTKKVIMEERNVYCGAYNVMVVVDAEDVHRVMHTDGSNLIALGSKDRKVRFMDCDSGKETGPVITGHAGSIRCVYLLKDRGMVLSGSYDTSVRCWSIETGQCLKILRGHQDTIVTIIVLGNVVATGAKDNHCKIWNLETGKCQKTFKHRAPVLSVALSEETCISGCENGKVKVWELASGNLIKVLTGHHGPVTGIKFDRWHIVTASKDGYALTWSALGKFSRCLTALRHPKEVLCLEFVYLRVITGSADGRLRIWNMVTGQCCRIMRGNSRSDPILSVLAIGDRVTVNTLNNLLVLNFEPVSWDYTLETDKVPPLVQYGSYTDAPVRNQPYAYVRAQRMKKAGASNYKIVHHDSPPPECNTTMVLLQHQYRATQLPHSAKSLSLRSMENAKRVQSSLRFYSEGAPSTTYDEYSPRQEYKGGSISDQHLLSSKRQTTQQAQSQHSASRAKSRIRSAPSQHSVTIKEQQPYYDDDSDAGKDAPHQGRRISWAFDKPLVPKGKDITLSEMKSLLRSQIRMQSESIVPPDFIYLTVNSIQNSYINCETSANTKFNMKDVKPIAPTLRKRPNSSPSRIDPRTKIPVEELGLEIFQSEDGTVSEVSDHRSVRSFKTKEQPKPPPVPAKEGFLTQCSSAPIRYTPSLSLHPQRVKSTVPSGRIIRPVSAGPLNSNVKALLSHNLMSKPPRPDTAPVKIRPTSVKSVPASIAPSLPGAAILNQRPRSQPVTSSTRDAKPVPMLMYSKEVREKAAELKAQMKNRQAPMELGPDGRPLGKVSMFNQPMREHVKFELRTHQQEEAYVTQIGRFHDEQRKKEQKVLEKKKKAAWLVMAKGAKGGDVNHNRSTTSTPELEE